MDHSKQREDFDYFFEKICKHPSIIKHQTERKIQQVYLGIRDKVTDTAALVMAMTEMTMLFQDGHTNIEIPYTENALCWNIPCEWTEAENQLPLLTLKEEWRGHKKGDLIKEINGISTSGLIEKMNRIIPHENNYLVMSRMVEYPYENYHLFSFRNLRYLFGETERYTITFDRNGSVTREEYPLEKYNGFLDFCEEDFITCEFSDDTVTIHLNSCICNDLYKQKLQEAACYCREKNIHTLVLDLSKNMGGDSSVIDEFIRRVPVKTFYRYEMIDYSTGVPVRKECRCRKIVNHPYHDLFPSNIICRVSHTTFSSARTFAVMLKDNGIAKIIGTPTGGKPTSYGMPMKYATPNCSIRFRVSRCEFLRPNSFGDQEISLFPDQDL